MVPSLLTAATMIPFLLTIFLPVMEGKHIRHGSEVAVLEEGE